jgi:hypothetical protein
LILSSPDRRILQTASGGTFRATLSDGRITGEIESALAELGASIEGDLVVSCWVPRSGSVGENGGTTDPSGSEVLVEDEELTSAACEPFKALRRAQP